MRVLSQAEIDAMLASLLSNPSILPTTPEDEPKSENTAPTEQK